MAKSAFIASVLAVAVSSPLPSASCEEAGLCDVIMDNENEALSLLQYRTAQKVDSTEAVQSRAMVPTLECVGEKFFDCFNFFDGPDPTNGHVKYVDWASANRFRLLRTNYEGTGGVYMAGFSGIGMQAMSVRLESKRKFNGGLFVLDLAHVPTGMGTWPAFWMHGDNWPMEGEFDMHESVNDMNISKTSIHTSPGCMMPSVYGMDNAGNGNANNAFEGSGVWGPASGHKFNDQGGGVIAVWWLTNGFSMYHFSRDEIPKDLAGGSPDPSGWGRPWRFFPLGSDCDRSHFRDMHLTINLAYCGEWAGRDFPGGNEACVDFINKNNVAEAYWVINYLKVFNIADV